MWSHPNAVRIIFRALHDQMSCSLASAAAKAAALHRNSETNWWASEYKDHTSRPTLYELRIFLVRNFEDFGMHHFPMVANLVPIENASVLALKDFWQSETGLWFTKCWDNSSVELKSSVCPSDPFLSYLAFFLHFRKVKVYGHKSCGMRSASYFWATSSWYNDCVSCSLDDVTCTAPDAKDKG